MYSAFSVDRVYYGRAFADIEVVVWEVKVGLWKDWIFLIVEVDGFEDSLIGEFV